MQLRRLSEGVAFHDRQVDGFVTRNIKSGKLNSALKKSSQSLSEGRLRSHSGFSNDPVEYAIASERYGFN